MLNLTEASFKKEVLESKHPVLVDFWAEWCGPCKMLAPVLEDVAKEYAHKVKFCKLNVDTSPNTATHYGVMSIPTLIFFKDGKVMAQATGVLNKVGLKKRIEENL